MKIVAKPTLLTKQIEYSKNIDPFVGFIAGFGSGKSDAAFFRSFELIKRRTAKNQKAVIPVIAPTYRILEDANIDDFLSALDRFKIKHHWSSQKKKITLKNPKFLKSEIWFRSCDKAENIVGFDATDAILDEFDIQKTHKQRIVWEKINGRMRGCKDSTLAISTTAEGFRFTYELFNTKKIGKLIRSRSYENIFLPIQYLWKNLFMQYGKNVPSQIPERLIELHEKYHNEKIKAKKDLFKFSLFDLWNEYYTKHNTPLLSQYVGGEFVNVNGLQACYAFNKERDVIDPIDTKNLPPLLYIGMDFNVSPFTATISFVDEYEDYTNEIKRIITFDERFIVNTGINPNMGTWTNQMMESILKDYPTAYYKNKYRQDIELQNKKTYRVIVCPDMSGMRGLGKRQTSASSTDIQIIQSYGCEVMGLFNPSVRDRLNSANQAFVNEKNKITSNCVKLIEDLDQVVTNEYGDLDKSDPMRCQIFDAHTYKLFRLFPVEYNKNKTTRVQ